MKANLRPALLLIALISALTIAPIAPEIGNVGFLSASIVALFLLSPREIFRPIVWMPVAGVAIVAIAYIAATRSIVGAYGALYFAPLLAIWPIISLGKSVRFDGAGTGLMCLCGVAGTALVALIEQATTDTIRAGESVANPIHFADTALFVGFFCLIGLFYSTSRYRYLYLLGPAICIATLLLSGTRGALVAFAVMSLVGILAAAFSGFITRRLVISSIVLLSLAAAAAVARGVKQTSGVQRFMPASGMIADKSSIERLEMYEGALRAFLDAPIFGHGPFDYVAAAASRADHPFAAPHLHSDMADFAASGGIFGLVAYFLFLLAPIVEVLRSPPSANRRAVIAFTATLTSGFFVMGLTNAMFGILTLTVLYSTFSAVIGTASKNSDRLV